MKHEISAGGIVFRKNNDGSIDWLICQHSQHKGWVFPKGLVGDVRDGESYEEAALRETEEEGGITARIIQKLPKEVHFTYQFKGGPVEKTVHYYVMEYLSGDPRNHDYEMIDAKFLSEEEIKKTLTYPSDKEAFEEALKFFEKAGP